MPQHINSHIQECVNNCQDAQEECLQAVTYCLEQGEEYADADCIALLITCEAIAGASAKAMLVGSEYHPKVCKVTAEICEAVARDFEEFDDRFARRLVNVTRRAAESCREMAQMGTAGRIFRGAKAAFGGYDYGRYAY